jgi:dTDP-4-dehydrorhamnose reductase
LELVQEWLNGDDKQTKVRVLITGSSGQLGRELMKALADEELITPTHEKIDIRDASIIGKIVKLEPRIIIHAAGYTDVDECEINKDLAWETNSNGTKHMAKAAAELQATLLYISTDYVFDGTKKEPYLESDRPNPLNIYGKSKLSGENFVQKICPKFFIIRTSWLYSNSGKNFVNTILELAKVKKEIKVVNDQIGSPTYANDLANAIKRFMSIGSYGIYHASGEGECSWYDFALEIIKIAGYDAKVIPICTSDIARPANRPHYSALRNSKLADLSITMRPWKDALLEFFKNYQDHNRSSTSFRQ